MAKKARKPSTKPHHLQKGFIIPSWTLEILLMMVIIISDIMLDASSGFSIGSVVLTMICACHTVLNITEIILIIVKRLRPLTYLLLQILKTTIWLALTLISMLNVWNEVPRQDDQDSVALIPTLLQPVCALTLSIATLIYSSVIYGRYRRFTKQLKLHPEIGLELVPDSKPEFEDAFECDGSTTVYSPCESDMWPIKGSEVVDVKGLQELGDEAFILQMEGGGVEVEDGEEVHELAAARSRAASVKVR